MAAQKGRNMLLKISNGASPATFTTVAGLQSNTLTINGEAVDVTTKDDAENNTSSVKRRLLEFGGVVSVQIQGTGIFQDDATLQTIRNLAMQNDMQEYQMIFDNSDILQGVFMVTSLEFSGEFNGAQQYSITLESSGKATYMIL